MLFSLLQGLVDGTMYGLFALAIVLVHRGTRVINFAAPALGSLGLYVTHQLHVERDWPWLLAALVGLVAAGVTALCFEQFVVRRMHDAQPLAVAVATIGLMLLIISGELVLFGGSPRNLPPPITGSGLTLFDVSLTPVKLLSVVVALAIAAGLTQYLRRTDFGLGVQAAAMDSQAVRLVGVPLHRVNRFVWVVGGVLPVVAAVLVLPSIGGFAPATVTTTFFVPALAAALIGGLDDLDGALLGGVVVGVVSQFSQYLVLTLDLRILAPQYVAILAMIVTVLLVAPRGVLRLVRELSS